MVSITQQPRTKLRGRARTVELAAEFEAERVREESALVTDLGHVPSYAERVLIEQLSTLIVRGRRLRQAGQGADAQMTARLVIRGLAKLGIRQGEAKSPADRAADFRAEMLAAATPKKESVA